MRCSPTDQSGDLMYYFVAVQEDEDISGEKVSPASRYHTATAHTVLTALIRWVQLPQLMLSDLPYQCVEGVLDSLSTDKRRNVTERHIQRSIRSGVHCAHLL